MLDLTKFGIGLGDNPDMTDRRVIAAQERIAEACEIGTASVVAGMARLDLREFRGTPAGGYVDGAVVNVESAEQVAADLLRWFRPEAAFTRAWALLGGHD